MYLFLMPNKLAIGGANGLAIVINKLLLPGVPVGIIMVIINVILFITAFSVIGKGFGIKTIYASFAVSLFNRKLYLESRNKDKLEKAYLSRRGKLIKQSILNP